MTELLNTPRRADRVAPPGWFRDGRAPTARPLDVARPGDEPPSWSTQSSRATGRETRVGTRQPRLLVAEDEAEMRNLLAWTLRKAGYDVDVAVDGLELLVKLYQSCAAVARGEARRWDLIISDIRMPALDGLDVLEGVASRDALPPVILTTAFGDAATHARAKRLGVAAIFDKPFDIDELVAKVREVVLVRDRDPSCVRVGRVQR